MVGFCNVLLPPSVTRKFVPEDRSRAIEVASVRVTGVPATCFVNVALPTVSIEVVTTLNAALLTNASVAEILVAKPTALENVFKLVNVLLPEIRANVELRSKPCEFKL